MTEGETLLRLMEQDLAIARAAKALDELPEKTAILQLRHRLKEIEGVAVKAEAYVRRANAMVAKSAHEVEMVQAKIDDEQAKVLSGQVNDPKELANLTREIDALSRRKDQLEREELGLMEKVEAGEAQRTKVDAALEEGRAKEAELVELYKARGGEIQTEIARLRAAREATAHMLDGSRPCTLRAAAGIQARRGGGGAQGRALHRMPHGDPRRRGPGAACWTGGGRVPQLQAHPGDRRRRVVSGMWTVNTDGGSRGNPGRQAPALVIRDPQARPWPGVAASWAWPPTTSPSTRPCCGVCVLPGRWGPHRFWCGRTAS